jgi:hypothetical protein
MVRSARIVRSGLMVYMIREIKIEKTNTFFNCIKQDEDIHYLR